MKAEKQPSARHRPTGTVIQSKTITRSWTSVNRPAICAAQELVGRSQELCCATTRVVAVTKMPMSDPIAREVFKIAWKQAMNELRKPPRIGDGPTTEEEYLALIAVLGDLAAGVEANLLVAMDQAATVFHVPHAAIGRACGVSRQAVRQRLERAKKAAQRRYDE